VYLRTRIPQANPLAQIHRQDAVLARELFDDPSTVWFTMVRTPFERFESAVREAADWCHTLLEEKSTSRAQNCSEITCSWVVGSKNHLKSLPLRSREHFLPQVWYMHSHSRSRLPLSAIFMLDEMIALSSFIRATLTGALIPETRAAAPKLPSGVHAQAHSYQQRPCVKSAQAVSWASQHYRVDTDILPWLTFGSSDMRGRDIE
jgi:hypothetical protein